MADEYTPTTEQVQEGFARATTTTLARELRAEFDRWLASVVRDAKAEAWDEGFRDGKRQDGEGDDGPRFTNPYRQTEG